MNEKPDQPAPADVGGELMSVEEFRQWIQDPENAEEWFKFLTGVKLPADAPPELVATHRACFEQRQTALAVSAVKQKIDALLAVMTQPPGTMLADERLAACKALVNEITDALLETAEPHRTNLLKRFLPIRERIRAIELET